MDRSLAVDANALKPLDAFNFIAWYEDFKNQVGRYGLAGREVLNCEQFDFTKEIRSDVWSYEVKSAATGKISTVTMPWDDRADREMTARNALLETRKTTCESERGKLWAHAISRIDDTVKDRLTVTYGRKFTLAQKDKNCVALFGLFRLVCTGLAKDQLLELQAKLTTIKHTHGSEDFDTFLVRFETLCKQIRQAGHKMDERTKMQYLCRAVNKDFWKSELSQCHRLEVTDDAYPKYKDMTPQMSKYYRSIMKPSSGKKRSLDEASASDTARDDLGNPVLSENQLRKRLKAQRADIMALVTKELQKRAEDAAKSGGKKLGPCFMCGKMGHNSRGCKAKGVKCDTCKSDRHCTAMHKLSEEFKARMAKGKEKQVAHNKLMEAVEVTVEGEPIVEERFGHGECAVDAIQASFLAITVKPTDSDNEIKDTDDEEEGDDMEIVATLSAAAGNSGSSVAARPATRTAPTPPPVDSDEEEGEVSGRARKSPEIGGHTLRNTPVRDAIAAKAKAGPAKAKPIKAKPIKKRLSNVEYAIKAEEARRARGEHPIQMSGASSAGASKPSRWDTGAIFEDPDDVDAYYGQLGDDDDSDEESEPETAEPHQQVTKPSEPTERIPAKTWSEFKESFKGTDEEKGELVDLIDRYPQMNRNFVMGTYAFRQKEIEHRKWQLEKFKEVLDGGLAAYVHKCDKFLRKAKAEWTQTHGSHLSTQELERQLLQDQYTECTRLQNQLRSMVRNHPWLSLRDVDVKTMETWLDTPQMQLPEVCQEEGYEKRIQDHLKAQAAKAKAEAERKATAAGGPKSGVKAGSTAAAKAGPSTVGKAKDSGTAKSASSSEARAAESGTVRQPSTSAKKAPMSGEKADPVSQNKRPREEANTKPAGGVAKMAKQAEKPAGTQLEALGLVKCAGRPLIVRDEGALHIAEMERKRAKQEAEAKDAALMAKVQSARNAIIRSRASMESSLPNEEPAVKTPSAGPMEVVESGEGRAASMAESDEATAVTESSLLRGIISKVNAMPNPIEPTPSPPVPVVVAESPVGQRKSAVEASPAEAEIAVTSPVRHSPQTMSESVTTPLTVTTPVLTPTPLALTVEPSPVVVPAQAVQHPPTAPTAAVGGGVIMVPTALIDVYALPEGYTVREVRLNGPDGGKVTVIEREDGATMSASQIREVIAVAQSTGLSDERVSVMPGNVLRERMASGRLYGLPADAQFLTVKVKTVNGQRVFVVDSGASTAVFRMWNEFWQLDPLSTTYEMRAANGARMGVDRVGLTPGLGKVIVSKDASCDVLSVSQLIAANPGCEVTFKASGVMITHPNLPGGIKGKVTATGLYSIDLASVERLIRGSVNVAETFPIVSEPVDVSAAAGAEDELTQSLAATGVGESPAQAEGGGAAAGAAPLKRELTPKEVRRATAVQQLHVSLGHPSDEQLSNSLTYGTIVGTELTARDVDNARRYFGECISCRASLTKRASYGESISEVVTGVGERVYADVLPLSRFDSSNSNSGVYGDYTCILFVVDSFSSMLHYIPLSSKESKVLFQEGLLKLISQYKEFDHKIKELHTDAESCLIACATHLGLHGISLKVAEPGQHCQRIERAVQTLHGRMLCIRNASPIDIPRKMLVQVGLAATAYTNDMPNTNHVSQTPRMMFQGLRLDLRNKNVVPFGTVAHLPFPNDEEQKTRLGVVLGPAARTAGAYNCWVFNTQRIIVRARLWPVTVMPENLPWKVKMGIENHMILKKPHGNKGSKKSKTVVSSIHGNKRAYDPADGVSDEADPYILEQVAKMIANGETEEYDDDIESPLGGDNGVAANVTLAAPAVKRAKVDPKDVLSYEEAMDRAVAHRLLTKRQKQAEDNRALKRKKDLEEQLAIAKFATTVALLKEQEAQAKYRTAALNGTAATAVMPDSAAEADGATADGPEDGESESVDARSEGVKAQKDREDTKRKLKYDNLNPGSTRHSDRQLERRLKHLMIQVRRLGSKNQRRILQLYNISVKEGLKSDKAYECKMAVRGEIQNMLDYKVGHYIKYHDIPEDKKGNILESFMFLKHKMTPDGQYDKTKARMVGNGANQKRHMYDLVSSSTVGLSSVFLLCNIASHYRAKLNTYDITGAFLHAGFTPEDEVTYIRVNKEVTQLWIEQDPSAAPFVDKRGTLLLELDKFIYGLKQAPLKFQLLISKVLTDMGYIQQSHDECLYIKHVGKDFSMLSIHVDDIMQVATSQTLYDELAEGLRNSFPKITATENATQYLGMTIERDPKDNRFIKLSQRRLIDEIVDLFPRGPNDTKRYFSPAAKELFEVAAGSAELEKSAETFEDAAEGDLRPEPQKPEDSRPTAEEDEPQAPSNAKRQFLSVLMKIMYLARLTRPDILLAVTFLASRTHCATKKDFEHLLRIVRYLEVTKDLGVHLNCESLDLRCSCDASYAVHTPNANTKGHTGFMIGFGENMSYIHARSGKQKAASTSSSDAEIIALSDAMKMCTWMQELIDNLKLDNPKSEIVVYQDNQSVIKMAAESSGTKHSKHLLTKLTYCADRVHRGFAKIEYMETGCMTADVLTKPQAGGLFYKHISKLMGLQWGDKFKSGIHPKYAEAVSRRATDDVEE